MSAPVLVVGSVAIDAIETPFGRIDDALGGSANYFAAAASLLAPVGVVAVVGDDYDMERLDFLARRGVDLSGIERREGESFFWAGRYAYDLNSRETLETRLGVFADFDPVIPGRFRDAEWIFLGNIDPTLQLQVLEQVRTPKLVACDTMNYWIERTPEALLRLLERVDVLLVNDAEARELSGDYNLVRAAAWIRERGPRLVVIKKGEHGAILFGPDATFFVPGYPLEDVFDPTGAGDAFAGGFLGYLAARGVAGTEDLKRAMVYGSVMGSFAVEEFGLRRFLDLDPSEVHERVIAFRSMTTFDLDGMDG
ncbi:MAG TPA: PfkB family carbohydrate kinase [Longimicrobiales bacterium]|nr:PfkB family carbohydrate kinase [Longimicrobiales bacterium]